MTYDKADVRGLGRIGALNPMYGAIAGGAAGTLVTLGVEEFTAWDDWSEAIGLGASVLTGGLMLLSPKTREAGKVAIAVGISTNGLRAAAKFVSGKQKLKSATGSAATTSGIRGLGAVIPQNIPTLGATIPQPIPALGGHLGSSRYGTTSMSKAR